MAGDEEKKTKKKKVKKAEKVEEPPPPAEEKKPEPAPAKGEEELPPPSEEAPPPEVDGEAPPAEAEAPPAEAPPAEEAPAPAPEGGEEAAEPPPAPKPKPKFFVHWNRRKARFYDYNFDYGENYYDSMVKYLDARSSVAPLYLEFAQTVPRRMAFAERGIRSSLVRKSMPDTRTATLLHDIKSSIKNFESSQKSYTQLRRKV